jgi:hypothetical protein
METPEDRGGREPATIPLPAPTVWPMVTALGVTLAFAGLVTHVAVSVVGVALALVAGVGWWREVLPVERVEHVPLRPPGERPRPIVPRPERVEHLRLGEMGHRVRIPVEVHPYSAGVIGGIVGGIAMAAVAMGYGLLFHRSVWYPINLLSAAAMPTMARAGMETLRRFDPTSFVVAVGAHGVLSVLVGLLYSAILPMLPRRPILWGGAVIPLLMSGLVWASLGVVNPTLNARIDWVWFVASQIAFGLATGAIVARTVPIATMQTWPLAARAGVEATGMPQERQGAE